MRYQELTETTRNLGGFSVKVVASVPGGNHQEHEVDEDTGTVTHRIGLTVTDPNHPMVSKRGETIQKTVRVKGDDREKAINGAIAHYRRKGYKVHDHHYIGTVDQGVAEGVAETLPMSDAVKVLKHYGAEHFKTTSNELHFYKNGRGLSVDLVWNDDATRSVTLSSLNSATRKLKGQGVAEGIDTEELANEVYAEFERIYPNLARRADERTVHAAIMDVLNYGGDSDPGALAQDVARAVKQEMQQGMSEGSELKQAKRKYNQAAKDANADQVGAGKKIDTMKKSLRQKDVDNKKAVEEGATGAKPGWMLKQDPALAKKVKDSKRGHEELKKWAGKPVPKDKAVDEGRFVKGPGGVPLDRQGNPIVPKAKAPASLGMQKWLVIHDGSHGEGGKDIIEAPNAETAWEIANEFDLDIIDIKPYRGPAEPTLVDEAIKLDAPQKAWSKQDMQDYLTRVKTGTKTKQDRFKPIIHGSNVKAITKDDGGEEWDLDDLARQITTRPRAILGSNAKMSKSKEEGAITYDLTLPALSGIVVDEETGEFVEIVTCPGAGECQLYCYARKGGYVMFPASSMSAAQALNFLVNHPEDYMKMFDSEVKKTKGQADKHGIKLLVRIHDAGDFFSKDYYNLMMNVARNNPDVKFYFYTKMGELATDSSAPPNVVSQFSPGAKSREVKTVQVSRDAGKHVKDAVTLPKDMFRDLFVTDAKGKYVKDEKGRTQVKSEAEWHQFKQKLAATYKLDPDTIVTYDEMNRIPEGPKPKWNVVVFPAGHGDLGASRLDVSKQFLMFH